MVARMVISMRYSKSTHETTPDWKFSAKNMVSLRNLRQTLKSGTHQKWALAAIVKAANGHN